MAYRTTDKMRARKEARRQRLLKSAIRLFGRKGFHATTVPMIVRAANSSTGSFYFYFDNKGDVFAAALRDLGERISAALNRALRAAGPNVLAQMRAAVKALVAFLAENPEDARILIVESSGLGRRLEDLRRQIIASHTRSVEQALSAMANRLPPLDASVAASCWVGAVYEAVYRWLESPAESRVPASRLAEAIVRFNLGGIGAPAAISEDNGHDH